MDLTEVGWDDVDWIHLAKNMRGCWLFQIRQWNFGVLKMQEISWMC